MTSPLYLYRMVGQLTQPPFQSVYWAVFNAPDTTGQYSGYFGSLQNITVVSTEQITAPSNNTPTLDATAINGVPVGNGPLASTQVLVFDETSNSYVPGTGPFTTNPKNATFGAKGDGRWTTASMTSGVATITIAGVTAADVGKLVIVDGAASGPVSLVGKLTSTTSLNVTCSHTVTNARCFLATDDTTAIESAISAVGAAGGGIVLFTAGLYGHTGLTISQPGVYLQGVGEGSGNTNVGGYSVPVTELRCCAAATDSLLFNGGTASATALVGCGLENISIAGNSQVVNCIRLLNSHHGHFAKFRTVDCSGQGLYTQFAIANVFDHHRHSTNENTPLLGATPTYGQRLGYSVTAGNSTTSSKILCPVIEGVTNGYFEESGNSNAIESGTYEGCSGIGMILGGFSANGCYSNVDLEANGADIQCQNGSAGHGFVIMQATSAGAGGGIEFKGGSSNHSVFGGDYTNVTIDTSALNVALKGTISAGAFTNNGTGTIGCVHLPSGFTPMLLPAGATVAFGLTVTGGTVTDKLEVDTDATHHAIIKTPSRNPVSGVSALELVLSSDSISGLYVDVDTSDTFAGYVGLGVIEIQGQKPGTRVLPIRLNPGGGPLSLGNGTGTISAHYTLQNQAGPTNLIAGGAADATKTFTLTGVAVGDSVIVNPRSVLATGITCYAYVASPNTIQFVYQNCTTGNITPGAVNFDFFVWRP